MHLAWLRAVDAFGLGSRVVWNGQRKRSPDAGLDTDAQPDGGEPDPKCNGHEELCLRRFNDVAFPMTHNSMSNAEAGWILPNQNFGITRQLNDGVRGLMLDTYDEDGELLLYHSVCVAKNQPPFEGLAEITGFLAANPEEIVSIIFENHITHAKTASAFEESGLIDCVYAHQIGEPVDDVFPWLMNIWDHAWETPFSFSIPEDFVCTPNRGNPANPLFLLNHFLTATLGGRPEFASRLL